MFAFRPVTAGIATAAFAAASSGRVSLDGDALAQGLMESLCAAELLAGRAGLVPMLDIPTELGTEKGVLTIGLARDRLARAPKSVRTLYLAAHQATRRAHASSLRATPSDAVLLPAAPTQLGFLPVLAYVAITVVGVAATVATAWYATHKDDARVAVDGQRLRDVARIAGLTKLGLAQLSTTGNIDPALYAQLAPFADKEARESWTPWIIGGAAVASAAALYTFTLHGERR